MKSDDINRMIEEKQKPFGETAKNEHEPWVKTYCGNKPNYTTPEAPELTDEELERELPAEAFGELSPVWKKQF